MCNFVEMDQLSAIKWTIMKKAKFGLQSLNAEEREKPSYSSTAWYCVLPPQEDSSVVIRRRRRMHLRRMLPSALPEQQHMFA